MPGGRQKPTNPKVVEQRRLIFVQTGQVQPVGENNWDPKPHLLSEAITSLIAMGAAVMFSSAGGGRVMGVKIYEGDASTDRKWLYDSEELDDWCIGVIEQARKAREGVGE
jgi:hypothetical protein